MPFITEELWHAIRDRDENDCMIVSDWPEARKFDNDLLKEADTLKEKKKNKDVSVSRIFRGTERFQPQLNPEISLTGDFYAGYTSNDDP